MRSLPLSQEIARHLTKCSLCAHVIGAGEIFWQVSSESRRLSFAICTGHIPLNTTGITSESDHENPGITYARPEAVNARVDIIPSLLSDWEQVYSLKPDQFEELVFDRLVAMGLQPIRLGPANRKDGGIDIIFWTCTLFPILGAVQVKHHRSPNQKTTSADVRDLAGGMRSYHFNVGLVVTNTALPMTQSLRAKKLVLHLSNFEMGRHCVNGSRMTSK